MPNNAEGKRVARRERALRVRMARDFPEAASLVGHRPLQREDVDIATTTLNLWLLSQRRLARELIIHYSSLPHVVVEVDSSGPVPRIVMREEEEPLALTWVAPSANNSPQEETSLADAWKLVLGYLLPGGRGGRVLAPREFAALYRCCRMWREVIAAFDLHSWLRVRATPNEKREFVVDLLAGKVVQIPFVLTGSAVRSPPPFAHNSNRCLAACRIQQGAAERVGRRFSRPFLEGRADVGRRRQAIPRPPRR